MNGIISNMDFSYADLLRSCVELYESMGMDSLDAYITDFEIMFLAQTKEFYHRKVICLEICLCVCICIHVMMILLFDIFLPLSFSLYILITIVNQADEWLAEDSTPAYLTKIENVLEQETVIDFILI